MIDVWAAEERMRFSTLACGMVTEERTRIQQEIILVPALELLGEVVDKSVIEVFTSQGSVTSGCLDFEETLIGHQ